VIRSTRPNPRVSSASSRTSRRPFESEITAKDQGLEPEKEEHARAVAERDEIQKKARKRGGERRLRPRARRKAEADTYEQQRKGPGAASSRSSSSQEQGVADRRRSSRRAGAPATRTTKQVEELPVKLEAGG